MFSEKIVDSFKILRSDEILVRRVYTITLVAAILVVVVFAKGLTDRRSYIYDSDGNIVGFERQSAAITETFRFKLSIIKGDERRSRDVTITKSKKQDAQKLEENEDAFADAEISGIITDAELSDKKRISLPQKLSDGTKLEWVGVDDSNSTANIIIAGYVVLIGIIIADKLRRPVTDGEVLRKKVLKGLPRFVNQLLLMMSSGMILSDALNMIADSYTVIPTERQGYFEKEYLEIMAKYRGHRVTPAARINELAKNTNVKELIRIASILYENEKRGFDITDNLSRESGFLWEDRKIVAKERGKIIDTKMSYPLGILLLLLIVITMAPAMINM